MKFYIPYADSEKQTENVFNATRDFAKETTNFDVKDTKIFSLSYHHEGKNYHAEVGKIHGRIGETVIVILESIAGYNKVYLICSPNRGVLRGGPCLVGADEVDEIVYFDKDSD